MPNPSAAIVVDRDTRANTRAVPVLAFLAGGGRRLLLTLMAGAMVLAAADGAQAGDCEGCSDAPCNDYGGNGLCCADLTGNGVVDDDDLALFLEALLLKDCDVDCSCPADLNHDGVVDDCDMCIMEHEYENCGSETPGYPPLLFETWNTLCYDDQCDPNCANDPNTCCHSWCATCLAGWGCLPLAETSCTFFDLDGDGWVDVLTRAVDAVDGSRKRLFWNDFGSGQERWIEGCLLADIETLATGGRGFTAGDFNEDGYPDFATQQTMDLLVNLGLRLRCESGIGCGAGSGQCQGADGANFQVVDDCYGIDFSPIETFCWGDADGDLDVDLFLPSEGSTYFLLNRGPGDPNCDPNDTEEPPIWWMDEKDTEDIGLPVVGYPAAPPEGCQFNDLDRDGDLDLVFNHRIYQNNTAAADDPSFLMLDPNDSGLDDLPGDNTSGRDEGLVLVDIDMDGDEDIVRTIWGGTGYVNANRGDGTFSSRVSTGVGSSASWGGSAADMDNDGDVDLTFGGQFVRNLVVETTSLGTSVCLAGGCLARTTCIFNDGDCSAFDRMLPSFADVDRDGDMDCAQVFAASHPHRLLRNRLYGTDCPEPQRRYVNVRPVRGLDPNVGPPGRDFTENEFGARVELVLRNNPIANTVHLRRVQCTSSAAGYLNQNEYLLHFGLPPDPDPNDPNEDLRFDLYVDFPARANEASEPEQGGLWRVDWTVNPQLANINLADLYVDPNDPNTFGRPITVYRDGRVRFKGADPNAITDPNAARLYTLGGPLLLPSDGGGSGPCVLPCPTSGDKLAGLRFTKDPNTDPVWIREIIIDGGLDPNAGAGCDYNIVVLDVTDANDPQPIGRLKSHTRNNRTFIPVPPNSDPNDPNAFLLPNVGSTRTYDVRVRVTSYRANPLTNLSALDGPLGINLTGGLQVINSSGNDICTKVMSLQFSGASYTSPVKVRLSRKLD